MLDKQTTDAYRRLLYGDQAFHAPANMVVQYQGEHACHGICLCLVLIMEDPRHQVTKERGYQHEFLTGELTYRPHARYTDDNHKGQGASNLIVGGAFYPEDWQYTYNEQGLLVPNQTYDPRSH